MTTEMTEPDQDRSIPSHPEKHLTELDKHRIDEQAKIFSDRARKHRRYAAYVFGFLILPSIVIGILGFIYAGELAGRDLVFIERQSRLGLIASYTNRQTILRDRQKTLTERQKTLTDRQKTLTDRQKTKISPEEQADIKKELTDIEKEQADIKKEQAALDHLIEQQKLRLEKMKVGGGNSMNDLPSLLGVSVTRFGTLGIIAFALTLFASLYRNNIRLAVFYEARADALRILLIDGIPTHHQHLQTLSDSMTPSVDFGKMSSTPIEHATKLAERAGSSLKK